MAKITMIIDKYIKILYNKDVTVGCITVTETNYIWERKRPMKKLALLFACIMVFASFATLSASADFATYTAAYAEEKPVIDGKSDDAAWEVAYWETMSKKWDGTQ